MIIYLDLILLICFICNSAILFCVSYLLKRKQTLMRIVVGAIVATLFIPLTLYFPHSLLNSILGKVLYSLVIIFVSFRINSFIFFIKSVATFYTVSIILGGSLLSIHYLFAYSNHSPMKQFLLYVNNIYGDEISIIILIIGFPFTLYAVKLWSDQMLMKQYEDEQQYYITLQWNGFRNGTVGFLDSGNYLNDPITNRPVVICDRTFMKHFFPKSDWKHVTRAINNHDLSQLPVTYYNQFVIVPFKTIADENHYLFAIKPDKLIIKTNARKYEIKKVLIGIQLSELTNDYHCLLHPQIMTLNRAEIYND